LASQQLDSLIHTHLHRFSLTHQRQETYKALQQQAQALPQVVEQLQNMMVQMAETSQQMNERLLANQESFHSQVQTTYTGLAQSVDQSLRSSLSQSLQLASDGIRPVVQATMTQLTEQAQAMNERLLFNTQQQLGELQTHMAATASTVAQTSAETLTRHEKASSHMTERVGQTLDTFSQNFERSAQALVDQVTAAQTAQQALQSSADQQRLHAWQASLTQMAATLHSDWQTASAQTLAQQQTICDTLSRAAQDITTHTQTQAPQTLAEITRLMASSEALMRERIEVEPVARIGEPVANAESQEVAAKDQDGRRASARVVGKERRERMSGAASVRYRRRRGSREGKAGCTRVRDDAALDRR
jgi:hypothetical protein